MLQIDRAKKEKKIAFDTHEITLFSFNLFK